jgi:hypothetical protein
MSFHPTSLAKCAMMVTLMMVMGVGSVWADEVEIWTGSNGGYFVIPASNFSGKFDNVTSSTTLRIYIADVGLKQFCTAHSNSILSSGAKSVPANSAYYNNTDECYEIPKSDWSSTIATDLVNQGGLALEPTVYGTPITKVSLYTPSAVVDPFINQAASGCAQTRNSPPEELSRDLASKTINLSGASLSGVLYARIYVVDDKNKPVDPSGGLYSVSCPGATATQAGTNAKNGFYLYTGSELTKSDIQVTLNAGVGNFTKYRIVALLANNLSTATISSGTVTTEPQWQEEYTYSFTYPINQIPLTIADADMNKTQTELNIQSRLLSDLSTDRSTFCNGYYIAWYVQKKSNGEKQQINVSASQSEKWGLIVNNNPWPWTNSGTVLSLDNITDTGYRPGNMNSYGFEQVMGKCTVTIPNTISGGTIADWSDYQIVCEATDSYTGGEFQPKVRYTWSITPPVTFEYDGEIANTVAVTQQMTSATSSEETLDWTTTKASVAMPQTGWKYARFYVVDATGTAVDPTDNAHKLTVSGSPTLCETNESGYYVYNAGSDITLPTVTLTTQGSTVRAYKVVCWMATASTGVNMDGTTMTEEPDITHEYTYSFTYPVQHTEETGEVEWSPASMTVALDIDALKGAGYKAALGSNCHVVWTVENASGTAQTLTTGSSRQSGTWTYSIDGDNATFYAPSGVSFADVQNMKFVARLYETATGENDSDKSLTYTVSIVRTQFLGTLKYGGSEGSETIRDIDDAATNVSVPLSKALAGCSGAKYARVWLTQNGTAVDPAGKLSVGTAFTQDATYGYYLTGNPVTLSAATLTAAVGTLNQYEVHIALSTDDPTGTAAFGPRRAASLTSYEPDYDYLYTFKFAYTPKATYVHKYVKWNQSKAVLDLTSDIDVNDLLADGDPDGFYIKWYIQDGSNNAVALNNQDNWTLYMNNYNEIYPYALQDDQSFLFMYGNKDKWGTAVDVSQNGKHELNPTVFAPKDKKFEDYADFTVVCATSPYAPAVEKDGNNTVTKVTAEPTQETSYTYYIFHFNADGLPPYDLVNETDIAATKKLVPLSNYVSAANKLNVSDALAGNAKYVRIYVSKYGAASEESTNLTVSYDGTPLTQCSTGNKRYGWYLSLADGIDASKLSVTGLEPDEMLKYNVIIVSASEELTGAKEPAWEKKTVYSFQKEINRRILANSEQQSITADEQTDILTRLDAVVSDFSGSLYAKWYVLNPQGAVQSVSGGNYSGGDDWHFDLRYSGLGDWDKDGNILKYYTDRVANTSSSKIESGDGYTAQVAKAGGIYVPKALHTTDYIGYQVVFEFSDEYDISTNGADPGYKLKYVYTITDPNAFTGELSATGAADGMTQEVMRNEAAVTVDLTNGAFAHAKLDGQDLKYVRFYLADADGNLQDPTGKLTVQYNGGSTNVTACTNKEEGFYIYLGPDGGNIQTLDKSKITVQLKAPKAYKLYKVVGVFSTAMTEVLPEEGTTPLTREPDWELNYSWNFTYPDPTTKEITRTMEWRRREMQADASTTNPDTDWDTSWEELSLGQCIRWYVVNGSNEKQPLVYGDSRQTDTWTIAAHEPFEVSSNEALLVGTHPVTAGKWNSNWGKPAIYAPAGKTFEELQDYKIICEVAADANAEATPNARYTITMFKSYLGELKEEGGTGSETIKVDNNATTETVPLGNALTKWGGTGAKYARVWLTTADGTRIDPTGMLTVTGLTAFTTEGEKNVDFGFYVSSDVGISLADATLTAEAGTFDRYQVHVALSTDLPGTTEPDYDYEYAFHFKYDMKTKYKTVLYDETTRQCTPHLLGNWQEVGVDCNEGRTNLAANLYVRWYLEDKNTGNPIAMESLTSAQQYNALTGTDGYYRYGFESSQFADKGDGTAYNPTITLPSSVTDYKNVRVVCVVTTKTDTWNEPWTADPEEMQVKYVYDLRTTTDLDPETYPFVHYQGEGYRYVAEQGRTDLAAIRDYTKVSGTTVSKQYTWNFQTNTYEEIADKDIRQNVHTVHYYYYLNLNEGDEEELMLPLQYYTTGGNDTEPRAYYRWYDLNTDQKSDNLVAIGDKLVERTWGHVALAFGDDPCSGRVGVKFKAPTGFTSLTQSDEILIACDVSRYLDGMDDSFTYLVHEPTISERYLFHILPASILAAKTRTAAENLAAVETQIQTKNETDMPSILEYSGRIVVSTNNGTGKFSLRTKIRALNHYYVYDASDNVVAADYMQWYAYYKDETNTWWKGVINMGERKSQRQANYTLSDISGATWTKLSGDGTTAPTIKVGDRLEMIATVGNTAAGPEKELPIIWGELEIIDAPPVTLGNEPEERSSAYMRSEYNHANTLDFNDFFLIGKKKPENSFENYAKIPIEWPNAQYGFCYPQLYGLCATNKYAGWGVYGVSPLHGDYTLLKSMNVEGISQDENRDNQSILCQWWDTTTLFDITHERASGKAFGDTEDYGAFLYVDAADEARTIAQLEFDAALCANARLYYTAYVADITNGATKPQLRFRVSVEDNGQRVPVVSFVTGDIQEEVGGTIAEGQWYQVYGYTTIPAEMSNYLDGTMQHYFVEIDNYCDNTNGADYCVDQISFFTQSAQVHVRQLGSPCDEGSGVEVKVIAPADKLLAALGKNTGTKKVFYRLFKKHDNMNEPLLDIADEEVYGPGVYSGGDNESNIRYATVLVPTSYDEATLPVGDLPEGELSGYYKDSEGVVYFQFDDRFFPLEVNSTYFVSFYTMGNQEVIGFEGWGNPYVGSVCSTYSNYITPYVLRVDLESGGEYSDGNIGIDCGATEIDKTFNITVQYPTEDGYVPYTVKFDFWDGPKSEFKEIKEGDLYLEKALDHFRVNYPDYKTGDGEIPSTPKTTGGVEYTTDMYNLIYKWAVTEGKLKLLATTIFSHKFTSTEEGERKFAAIPVNRHVDEERYICSPLELAFKVTGSAGAPVMELGFSDVTYPEGYNKRVVRLGLEQFHKMKDSGYKLHLPVARYQNKGGSLNGKKLYFSGKSLELTATELKISATNDPTVAEGAKVADIIDPAGSSDVFVNTSRMYLPLDFTNGEVEFHEGYYYEVSTSYKDEDDTDENPCLGDLYIVFKVVPEFVTWNAHQIGTSKYYSGNWYDDQNWNRSTRAELYKDDANTHSQNSVTPGHPDRYKDNGEISELLTDRPGFVPMKFTYVTLLGDNHSPSLTNENYAGKIAGTPQTGGDMINPRNDLASDTSPSGSSAYLDDKFIRYDMLVRYGTHANGGEGCFGHQTMSQSGGAWGWNLFDIDSFTPIAECYDVEKFYGNICKEIYFKPRAELRLQQRLTYEKAWVEEEFVPGQWYLMSTPLKGTYAGDMYVPTTNTEATNGRQLTEAFQPIRFSVTPSLWEGTGVGSGSYSRTKYPFYQRSWNLEQAKVITKTNDVRATDYSARLAFSGVTSNLIEWSHVFNDVEVPYNNFGGFAIRAHKKAQTGNALLRLPKYDTSYDYYQWDNTIPATGAVDAKTVTKGEGVYGRFVFDNTSADVEEWKIPLSQLQAQGTDEDGYTYYLVGNPFMASIDMGRFFGYGDREDYYSYNPKLSPVYYIYKDGAARAVNATDEITAENKADRIIRPLQAFIIRCKASEAPENIVFNRWVITDGNYTDPTQYVPENNGQDPQGDGQQEPSPVLWVSLTASDGEHTSRADIALDADAATGYAETEDAPTLFDSNLADVPTIYTVAGERAVSIDHRPQLDMVPFGVVGNDNVNVNVNVNDNVNDNDNAHRSTLHAQPSTLYVYDALTGESTEVGEDGTVTIQPNDYGRYFLTSTEVSSPLERQNEVSIIVSVRGSQVTVTATDDLQQVRAVSVSGATMYQAADCGTNCQFQLQPGTYIIDAESADGRKTVKVFVR